MATAMLAAAGPEAASGAIWVQFDPPSARPGETVVVRTVDASMVMITERRLELFLVRRAVADDIRAADDPRLTPIGDLRADRDDVGRLSFTAPDLPPGRYQTVAHCRSCDTTFTVGPFRVASRTTAPLPAAPGSDADQSASPIRVVVGAAGAALVLGLGLTLVTRAGRARGRRSSRSA